MSTWNGQRHIEAQIDSILAQRFDGRIDILIRDDGSEDETVKLIEAYGLSQINIIRGKNIGAKASFLEVIRLAQTIDADYYALADQDDVWLPEKINRAVSCMGNVDEPVLYCSSLRIVDEQLRFIRTHQHPGNKTFRSSMLQNFATGCTCVMNKPMLQKIHPPSHIEDIMMHDWWIANIAMSFGSVYYDEVSFIDYRQHAGNQIGVATGIQSFVRRWKKFTFSPRTPSRLTQMHALYSLYGNEFSIPCRNELISFIKHADSWTRRMRYLWLNCSNIDPLSALRFIIRI